MTTSKANKADNEIPAAPQRDAATEAKIQFQRELKQKGNDCLQSNNKKGFEDAHAIYTQALEEGEFDGELTSQIYSNRSHVSLMLRKNVEAVDDARKAIKANPKNVKPYWYFF